MTRVLIFNDKTDAMAARLTEAAPGTEIATCESYTDLPELVDRFDPDIAYVVCFAGRSGFPREALLARDRLKWISNGGSGVDHLTPWNPDDVTVTNSAGVAANMMAEYVFGSILHFTLDVPGLQADKARHHWMPGRLVQPIEGKTILIVGLGQTGQAVARRAKAFGLNVIGTRTRPQPVSHVDEVYSSEYLAELWPRADFVVLSVPLLSSTRHLLDAQALAAMKETAILVDVSRGGVVDESAMINALRHRSIAGAALDVFASEPLPADSPYWEIENLLISPHCSSVYAEWAMQSFELFLQNLTRWQAGMRLCNVVDPTRGY